MQVTETRTEGLQREFRVVVPAADLEAKVNARLTELKDRVQIRGFRPGKVPVAHLKRVYGRGTMAEVIDATVREANIKIVTDRGFKLATDPKVTLPTEQGEIDGLLRGKSDLSYTVALEIVPPIQLAEFKNLKLERLNADVTDAEIEKSLQQIAEQNQPYAAKGDDAKVETGDRVTISFVGTIDGKAFESGSGEDVALRIGSGTFLPGFEDQLIGMAKGETRVVKVTLPPNYGNDKIAGKDAEFETTVNTLEAPGKVTIDDTFATSLGMESLAKLKDAVKDRIARDHTAASRRLVKRSLLDQLDTMHKFDPPPTLVDEEFEQVWKTILSDLQTQNRSFADEDTTEEAARAEYREIAARRVRLGLVLAEIGDKNHIQVTDEEVTRSVVDRARQFPGKEEQVWEYYRNNPNALATLRAPVFEEKVIDFLIELANVTDKKVSIEELYRDEEEDTAETKP
ncbi:MAG: trigger factor [Alphaproteobacteria bacterium]|nr:trigger factor [Alphaproteobacteria bacterium]